MRRLPYAFLLLLLPALVLLPGAASANCGLVASNGARLWRANTGEEAVTLTFLGHASYLIRTPGGVTVVTDYNGMNVPDAPPDVATMNHAHTTHYTDYPDPRIRHVLRGWTDDGSPARIDLKLGDLRVRNIPTNIREWYGRGTQYYGNSIFVFEAGGLCIAHLGHLHHLLTPDDLAALGRIDVLIAPADGMWTLSHKDLLAVMEQVHAPVTILMHYFTSSVLDRFLAQAQDRYPVHRTPSATVTLSAATLPAAPQILILPGGY